MNILITDPIEAQAVEILKKEGFGADVRLNLSPDEIKKIIGTYEALIVRSGTKVTDEILSSAKKMKVVGRAGTGVDNIDVDAATRLGIIVLNVPGGNTVSTAEHTISMMMALARNIPQANQSTKEGKWERKKFVGTELLGKTLGVVGLGKVGKEVAKRCSAFEMNVIAFDPVISTEAALKLGIELVDLQKLLKRSDFITIHTPLMSETKGLLNEKTLSQCKQGVRIINCARGGIVDEKALLVALEKGIVAGAALDVFEQEPPTNNPLLQHPNVVVTPHLGASTEEAQEKVAIQIAHQVVDALNDKEIVGSVNADVIAYSKRPELQPYLTLAEKLGMMVAQLSQGKLQRIVVRTTGSLLTGSNTALAAAVLKGIFERLFEESINYISAPFIARERGINVSTLEEEAHESYTHLLSVQYETDKEKRRFSGTLFGSKNIRIVEVDGFYMEAKPEGYLLLCSNVDRPGMLAAVSSVLAKANINIAGLSLGRSGVGQDALTVMNLDSHASDEVLKEISGLNGILGVKVISL